MKRNANKVRVTLSVIVGIVALVIALITPSLQRLRETRGSTPCASNMPRIGQALLLYSLDHDGRYPQKLDELVGPGMLQRETLVCAVSGKPIVFATAGAVGKELGADDVVAYEPLAAHDNEGSNTLYSDGHVTWLTAAELGQALARSTTRATK